MLAAIASILTSGVWGTVFGFFGSIANGYLDLKKKKLDQEFELKKMDKDLEITKLEAATSIRVAETQADGVRDAADAGALSASYTTDHAVYTEWEGLPPWGRICMVLLEILRGSVRPILSYAAFIALVSMVFYLLTLVPLKDLVTLNPTAFWSTYLLVMETSVFLFSATIGWWFGARSRDFSRKRE